MSNKYQPLHHKYRPEQLDELIGQDAIASTLKQALKTNRIAPAYIFSGPRGTGKTSSARIFAKSLNCVSEAFPTISPCGQCELCKTITNGTALDVIEIDAASNTGVENIRELIERSRFAPVQARWKVYVIDECHMLSTAAFNALLKTLEEPPPQVVFILATTDPQRVLPTILSRCMRFDFRRIALDAMKKHLEMIANKEKIDINNDALLLISRRSQGGLRDAESMLDQLSLLPPPISTSDVWNLLGAVPEEELLHLARAITSKNPKSVLNTCRELLDHGKDPITILQGLASILRDLIIKKTAPEYPDLCNISPENDNHLTSLSKQVDLELLLNLQANLKGSEIQLRNSMQPRLWLEVLMLGMLANPVDKVSSNINTKNISENLSLASREKEIQETTRDEIGNLPSKNEITTVPEQTTDTNLDTIWEEILAILELPSTRMLLSQQAKLTRVEKEIIEISVTEKWMSMIESRRSLIEEAVEKSLNSSKKIIFKRQNENKKIINSMNKNLKPKEDLKPKNQKINQSKNMNVRNIETNSDHDMKKNNIDNTAEQLASFFNGKIVDLE